MWLIVSSHIEDAISLATVLNQEWRAYSPNGADPRIVR